MPWAARLLAVACVSLAAKMEEYRAPALPEFRADDEYDFSSVSIRRMELLVLSTLGWRMGDVTPLDYLPCLSSSRLRRGGDGGLVAAKAAALIFSTAEGKLANCCAKANGPHPFAWSVALFACLGVRIWI